MRFIFLLLTLAGAFGIAIGAHAENDDLIDELAREITLDKAQFDAEYGAANIAATFEACFRPYGVTIRGVNHKPSDYQEFGKHNLTQPYETYGAVFLTQNQASLVALKEAEGVTPDKLRSAMDIYRAGREELSQTLFKECDTWARMTKWDFDIGVNIHYGEPLSDAQLALMRSSPFDATRRIKTRDRELERISRINAFANLSAVAAPNQPHNVDELIQRLREEARRAGPPAPGETQFAISEADLADLKRKLDSLSLTDSDWTYLIARHFSESGRFDPQKWKDFVEFSAFSRVSDRQKQTAKDIDEAMKSRLGLSNQTIEKLRDAFFRGTTLHRLDTSSRFGNNYDAYLINRLSNPDAALNAVLSAEEKATLKRWFADDPTEPEQPSVYGVDELRHEDCSWNAVLERMKAADPSFAIKWNLYFVQGSIVSMLGPGSSGGTTGAGTAFKRSVLVAGVREAVKRCVARNR